jgi:hypothetical protein
MIPVADSGSTKTEWRTIEDTSSGGISFDDFIRREILQYPESNDFPVHFTGSIAFHFRKFLEDQLTKNNFRTGKITLSPMVDLVIYHIRNLNKT